MTNIQIYEHFSWKTPNKNWLKLRQLQQTAILHISSNSMLYLFSKLPILFLNQYSKKCLILHLGDLRHTFHWKTLGANGLDYCSGQLQRFFFRRPKAHVDHPDGISYQAQGAQIRGSQVSPRPISASGEFVGNLSHKLLNHI